MGVYSLLVTSLSVPPHGPLEGEGPYGSIPSASDVTQCPSLWPINRSGLCYSLCTDKKELTQQVPSPYAPLSPVTARPAWQQCLDSCQGDFEFWGYD